MDTYSVDVVRDYGTSRPVCAAISNFTQSNSMNHYEKLKRAYEYNFGQYFSDIDLREVIHLWMVVTVYQHPTKSELFVLVSEDIDLSKSLKDQPEVCEKLCEIIGIE